MDFKRSLLQDDHVQVFKQPDKYYDWETIKYVVDEYLKTTYCMRNNTEKNNNHSEQKYTILAANDSMLYNETEYLKERFFFKGVLVNPNMGKLVDIYVKNMNIEDIVDDNDDEDYVCEEEEIII